MLINVKILAIQKVILIFAVLNKKEQSYENTL